MLERRFRCTAPLNKLFFFSLKKNNNKNKKNMKEA